MLSCTGGLGDIATSTYKCIASLLADKCNQPYSSTCAGLDAHSHFLYFDHLFKLFVDHVLQQVEPSNQATLPLTVSSLSHGCRLAAMSELCGSYRWTLSSLIPNSLYINFVCLFGLLFYFVNSLLNYLLYCALVQFHLHLYIYLRNCSNKERTAVLHEPATACMLHSQAFLHCTISLSTVVKELHAHHHVKELHVHH